MKNWKHVYFSFQNTNIFATCIFNILEILLVKVFYSIIWSKPFGVLKCVLAISELFIINVSFSSSVVFLKEYKRTPNGSITGFYFVMKLQIHFITFPGFHFPSVCTIYGGCHISPGWTVNQTSSASQVEEWRWKAQWKIYKVQLEPYDQRYWSNTFWRKAK